MHETIADILRFHPFLGGAGNDWEAKVQCTVATAMTNATERAVARGQVLWLLIVFWGALAWKSGPFFIVSCTFVGR